MDLRERISRGLDGFYQGLANGFSKINGYIFGIQRATYYLIGGLSGSGKTTVADFMVQNAIKDADEKEIHLDVFYYSYEISEIQKKINWMSVHIFNKYGEVIPPKVIGGMGDENMMSLRQQELVNAEIPYIESVFRRIRFSFDNVNPTGVRNELLAYAEANGTFIYENYRDEKGQQQKRVIGYTPNNPNAYVIVVIDHLALSKIERKYSLKENMDKLSEYLIWFRNMCHYTPVVVQQFNQGLNSVDRMKFKGVDLSPQQSDFKDTTNPYQDADVVIGMMNPAKMDFKEFMGYKLDRIGDRLRIFKIIKNRYEADNVVMALHFKAEAGYFAEMPSPEEFEIGLRDYNDYV